MHLECSYLLPVLQGILAMVEEEEEVVTAVAEEAERYFVDLLLMEEGVVVVPKPRMVMVAVVPLVQSVRHQEMAMLFLIDKVVLFSSNAVVVTMNRVW